MTVNKEATIVWSDRNPPRVETVTIIKDPGQGSIVTIRGDNGKLRDVYRSELTKRKTRIS